MDRGTDRESAPPSLASFPFGESGDHGITLLTRSTSMRDRIALAMRAAVGDIPVLIAGEKGTGNEIADLPRVPKCDLTRRCRRRHIPGS